jgi:transposase
MNFPIVQQAQALSRDAFESFCREHHYYWQRRIAQRYAELMEPAPQASPAAVHAYEDEIHILAQLLLPHVRCRVEATSRLAKLFQDHPDAFIFDSLPGAGELLALALLAKFGDHRDRFPTPNAVQALAGTCPVTKVASARAFTSAEAATRSSAVSPSSSR